jgi:predicted regulator of Ras-like GTPase activity (Roadblock/LC7/MglB family)
MALPALIEEDVRILDAALDDFLARSEASIALIIDKGGPLISRRGAADGFDTTTIAALAAGSFCATQAIAGLIGETAFSNIYQQGEHHSLLFCNIDDDVLLIVIFNAETGAGAVKYYAEAAAARINQHLQKARQRAPQESLDLVSMNISDVSDIFKARRRS